jgi:tetratricopeptide (TPR) repeat protein
MNNLKFITLASVAFFAAGTMAQAASTGTSGGSTPTVTSPAKLKCKRAFVVKTVNGVKKCVRMKKSEISDEDLYEQARSLAKEGHYEWALELLAQIENQNDPKVLNYTGYSHRKSGRLETAIGFYRKALDINPDYVLAREYLGEGYAAAGQVQLARVELAEIEKRCGVQCTEYQDLNAAIQVALN